MPKLDLATVFYAGDSILMQLQARSMERFMDPEAVASIYLVENETPGVISETQRDKIKAQYGALASKVKFIPREQLGYFPAPEKGWRTQQALKLAIGKECTQDYVVLLDCKNHLIRPANFEHFVTPEGRIRQYYSRKYDPQQVFWLEESWKYFGMNRVYGGENLPSTITPYPINTEILQNLVDEINIRDGSVFALMNREDFGGTEFYLLLAYVQSHLDETLNSIYDNSMPRPATFFASWPQHENDIESVLEVAENAETCFFALHPSRKKPFTPAQWQRVLNLWEKLDISIPEVINFYETSMQISAR